MRGAHRVAYEIVKGPIPKGLQIDHLCRVPACINPNHLEAVTAQVNTLRGVSPAAQQARQTHCKRGHELNAVNMVRYGDGHRRCKTCESYRERS